MAVARVSIGSAAPALLAVLLVCAAARFAVVVGGSLCDGVSCGMGICGEITVLPRSPTYECDCDDGWARIIPSVPSLPCYIPNCSSGHTCYSTTSTVKVPPVGSNVTLHPCLVMDCGPEGTCVEEQDKPLRCQCNSGATNLLKNPSLPCAKNDCVIGEDGCPVQNPPPPSVIVHESAPSSPGSICSPDLLLPMLLLLASLYIIS